MLRFSKIGKSISHHFAGQKLLSILNRPRPVSNEKIRIKFRIRICLEVRGSCYALLLFTDTNLKVFKFHRFNARNVLSLNLKFLYILVSMLYKIMLKRSSFLYQKWKRVFIMMRSYKTERKSTTCNQNFENSYFSKYSTD